MLPTEVADNKEGILWNGQLACLEFFLHHSISLRLKYYRKEHVSLQTASALSASVDSLVQSFKHNPELIAGQPRLISLLTLAALVGTTLYFNHPECPLSSSTRCCNEHRPAGWRAALDILQHHFSRHFDLAVAYKTVAVLIASVITVVESGTGSESAELFQTTVSELFDLDTIGSKVKKTVRDVSDEISRDCYDVDVDRFEVTLHEILSKHARTLGINNPTLIDRFSDLVFPSLNGQIKGAELSEADSISMEISPSVPDLEKVDENDKDIMNKEPASTMSTQPLLQVIPGSKFREVLVSDAELERIIHTNNSNVQEFIKSRASKSLNITKLTDRHDSAIQIDWTEPELVESKQIRYETQEPSEIVSAVNPAFIPRPRKQEVSRLSNPSESSSELVIERQDLKASRQGARRPWTQKEVDDLKEGYKRFGPDWRAIQHAYGFANSRSNVDLKDKYRNLLKRGEV